MIQGYNECYSQSVVRTHWFAISWWQLLPSWRRRPGRPPLWWAGRSRSESAWPHGRWSLANRGEHCYSKHHKNLPPAPLFKTTLCERRRVPSEESIRTDDRWLELWVNAGKFNCSSESSHDRERQRGKRAICVIPLSWRGHRKQVPGDMPAPMGGPATKRGGRRPKKHCTTHEAVPANWLSPSAARWAAEHRPDKPVTTQGRGRCSGEETEGSRGK